MIDDVGTFEELRPAFEFTWTDQHGGRWENRVQDETMRNRFIGWVYLDGKHVGSSKRLVSRLDPNSLCVEHVTMNIEPHVQGRGFGSAFFEASLERYPTFGITRVIIQAADRGRTTWARDPVRFEDPRVPRSWINDWRGVGPNGFVDDARAAGCVHADIDAVIAAASDNLAEVTPAMLKVSDAGRMLLRYQPSWRGVVDLRVDGDASSSWT